MTTQILTRPEAGDQRARPLSEADGPDAEHRRERLLSTNAAVAALAQPVDREAITARVIADARRAYGEQIDATTLEAYAREAVEALWHDNPTVFQFIPTLALRHVHEQVKSHTGRARFPAA